MNRIIETMLIKWAGAPLAIWLAAVAIMAVGAVLIVILCRKVRFRFKGKNRCITVEIDAYDCKQNRR